MKRDYQFYDQPTLNVARQLVGDQLIFTGPHGRRIGRIIETEAYVGPEDLASHASRGITKRTKPMFGQAGFTYVYLIYGMYWCLNIVAEAQEFPAAVLIRALEPIEPLNVARIAAGPGKVCQWLGLTGEQNEIDVTGEILYIERGELGPKEKVVSVPRIGVDYAGEWAAKPWRFYIKDHPSVSKR